MIQSCNAKIRYASIRFSGIIRPIFARALVFLIYLIIRLLNLRWSVVVFDVILEVLRAIVCVNTRYTARPVHGEASKFREWRVCTIFAQHHNSMQQLADFQFVEIISDKVDSTSLSEHLPFQSELNLNQRNKKRGEQWLRRKGFAYAKISIGSGMYSRPSLAPTSFVVPGRSNIRILQDCLSLTSLHSSKLPSKLRPTLNHKSNPPLPLTLW
jgi:hypothetical protein